MSLNRVTKYVGCRSLPHADRIDGTLISVRDEFRYLVKEEDMYCASLALQISDLWTRAIVSRCQFRSGSLSTSRVGWKRREEAGARARNMALNASVVHRTNVAAFSKADVEVFAQKLHGVGFEGGIGRGVGVKGKKGKRGRKGGMAPLGNGEGLIGVNTSYTGTCTSIVISVIHVNFSKQQGAPAPGIHIVYTSAKT